MRLRFLGRSSLIRTGLRFVLAVPSAVVLSTLLMFLPVRDAPGFGFGSDSLTCAVLMEITSPANWWVFTALEATLGALCAYFIDRLLARWMGGYGRRASIGLSAIMLVSIVIMLAVADVGIYC